MYWERCLRIRDFAKPTIAAVQGACSAAGLMLAAMCDLIVAADDARFSNPVLRMSGAGVELLVEPWELGPRKAKEFLLCAQTLDAPRGRAPRPGQPGRAPRAQLDAEAAEMAGQVALVPPVTAQAVKASINDMVDRMGQRDSWRYHFMVHQFVSNTETALGLATKRAEGGMDRVRAEQQAGPNRPATRPHPRRDRTAGGDAGARPGHPHRRPLLRRPAGRAGGRGHQDRAARHRRLHARDRAVRRARR